MSIATRRGDRRKNEGGLRSAGRSWWLWEWLENEEHLIQTSD